MKCPMVRIGMSTHVRRRVMVFSKGKFLMLLAAFTIFLVSGVLL